MAKTQNNGGHFKNGSVFKYLGGSWTFEHLIGFTMWIVVLLQVHGEKPLGAKHRNEAVIWIIHDLIIDFLSLPNGNESSIR